MSKKTSEIGLLAPRLVPLSVAQEREAVGLLAELLLEVAWKCRGGVSGSVFRWRIGRRYRRRRDAADEGWKGAQSGVIGASRRPRHRLSTGSSAASRRNASDFLLSGLVRCGRCGRAYIGMSARGNGGTYRYYACTGRQKCGPKACRGERFPQETRASRAAAARGHLPRRHTHPASDRQGRSESPTATTRTRATPRLDQRRDHPRRTSARALLRGVRTGQAVGRALRR